MQLSTLLALLDDQIEHSLDHEEWRLLGCYAVLLVTANVVPSPPSLVTLMMEALSSFKTSFITISALRNNPEDAILHSHRRENLKSYIVLTSPP
jgi:hypothetical protein